MSKEIFDKLRLAVLDFDQDQAEKAAVSIVEGGLDIQKGIAEATEAIRIVGDKFGRMEIYLPELMMAADVMKAGGRAVG